MKTRIFIILVLSVIYSFGAFLTTAMAQPVNYTFKSGTDALKVVRNADKTMTVFYPVVWVAGRDYSVSAASNQGELCRLFGFASDSAVDMMIDKVKPEVSIKVAHLVNSGGFVQVEKQDIIQSITCR